MRLFVAFEIPGEIRERLARRVGEIRPELPPASWVPPERLHLTLVFLGEVEERLLPAVGEALVPVFLGSAPLSMRLRGAGTFPPGRPARVAWIGVDTDGDLAGLERRARAALEPVLPGALEERPYHAHVTLARPRRPWSRAAVGRFERGLDCLDEVDGATPWEARHAVLMESRLGASGARYEVRRELPLSASRRAESA